MINSLVTYLAKMEKKSPTLFKKEYNMFIARAEKAVEDVGYDNGVRVILNPQTGDVVFEERLSEQEFAFIRKQAEEARDREVALMFARMKIQEIIDDNGGGYEKWLPSLPDM